MNYLDKDVLLYEISIAILKAINNCILHPNEQTGDTISDIISVLSANLSEKSIIKLKEGLTSNDNNILYNTVLTLLKILPCKLKWFIIAQLQLIVRSNVQYAIKKELEEIHLQKLT